MNIRRVWRKLVGWGINKRTIKWAALYVLLKWALTFTLVAYLIRVDKWNPIYWTIFPVLAVALFIWNKKKATPSRKLS